MNLIESLRSFDGKQTGTLAKLTERLPRDEATLLELLALAEHADEKIQVAATWILKRWLDEGMTYDNKTVSNLIKILKRANHWEVRLHILQILATSRIPPQSAAVLMRVLAKLAADDNKLIRAWSLSAFVSIADQKEGMRKNAIAMLSKAESDEAASVRARVRQIRKHYKWAADS